MSGKLGISGAFNRRRTLSPLQPCSSSPDIQKDSYAKIMNENKILKEKNKKLKEELQDLGSIVKQLTSESSHESFDERRVNLIKFQVIQLERQIVMLNEALGFRSESILEAENSMTWLADKLRSYLASDVKGPVVSISRSDLTLMIEGLESSRIKLFKSIEKCGKEEVGKNVLLMNPFLNQDVKHREKLSILDICLSQLDYLNLKHVAQLESKLCKLYKELICVHEQLHCTDSGHASIDDISRAAKDRLNDQLLKSSLVVKDVADDLLALSLLCPSSPWPVKTRPLTKEVPLDRVLAALPQLPKNKKDEVVHVLKASIGTCNHRYHLLEKEKSVLKEELTFHRSVYDLHIKHTTDLFEALRAGYQEFEKLAKDTISGPLDSMLKAYKKLKKSSSETALREFLLIMKDNEVQLSSVINMFDSKESESTGSDAIGVYGLELMTKLANITEQCQQQRDRAIKEKKSVREDFKLKERELQNLLEELEAKYDKQWQPCSYRTISSRCDSQESLLEPSDLLKPAEDFVVEHISQPQADQIHKTNRIIVEDPSILRSYLDEESGWDHFFGNTSSKTLQTTSKEEDSFKNEGTRNLSKKSSFKPSNEAPCLIQSVTNNSLTSARSKGSNKSNKWKPDKEWVNDFTSPPSPSNSENSLVTVGKGDKETQSISETDQSCSVNTHVSSQTKQRPTSYAPNLNVAQNSLRLKRQGTSFLASKSDRSLSKSDKR